jgi:type II secretion system protein H
VCRNNRSGFTLIEIMVVLTIIGLLAAIISPNFRSRKPEYERQQFLGSLNALVRLAAQQASATGKLHRLHFDFERNKVSVEVKVDGKNDKGEQAFKPMRAPYLRSVLTLPKYYRVENFSIEGKDEGSATTKKTAWFFIMPDGLAQDVIINITDRNPAYRNKPKQIGLVMNPFSAQFKIYDSFQK